jgi:hypothetical protein
VLSGLQHTFLWLSLQELGGNEVIQVRDSVGRLVPLTDLATGE